MTYLIIVAVVVAIVLLISIINRYRRCPSDKILVVYGTTGNRGSAKCENKKYDIIFIDHMMPEMNGLETFKRIRTDPDNINSGSVFVMLTANDETGVRDMFLNEGFDDFMSKPINVNELESILRKYSSK